MKKAVIPGSFDPVTNGHVDIIRRASRLFDEVVVLIGVNSSKKTLFTLSEREEMLRASLSGFPNVTVDSSSGLIVDYCLSHGAEYIVRGLRDAVDFSYEHELEINNRFLSERVETIYLSAGSDNLFVRSSSIREFLSYGVDVSSLVPEAVVEYLEKRRS